MSDSHILIIGSSMAALSAAEAARKQDPDIRITLLSDDIYPPYYRLRLCELLVDPAAQEKIVLHPADWYESRQLQVRQGERMERVLPDEKLVVLASGERLHYTKLILATGSKSFIPPIKGHELDGVVALWTMSDALAIEERIRHSRNAVVIGGGLLGLEAAHALAQRGIKTTILETAPYLLARQLDKRASELFAKQVDRVGVGVSLGTKIAEIYEGADGHVGGVRLDNGSEYPADLVFISTGVRPRLEALTDSGIAIDRHIVVNEKMESSVADIYAAGDCACFDKRWYGLWSISKLQGEVAGTNAAGGSAICHMPVPPYMVNTMNTRIASAGMIAADGTVGKAMHEEIKEDAQALLYDKRNYDGEHLKGFILLGDTKPFVSLNKNLGV